MCHEPERFEQLQEIIATNIQAKFEKIQQAVMEKSFTISIYP